MTAIDIPCDAQALDRDGHLWSFLHEASDPQRIVVGATVVTGDEEDPVIAEVVDIIDRPGGQKVVMRPTGAVLAQRRRTEPGSPA